MLQQGLAGLAKRAFDVTVAGGLLVVGAPALALAAAAIRVRMGSPVVFGQWRPGLRGKPIFVVKLRTMKAATDPAGRPLPDDQRIDPLGQWIRKYSLDELPQLWSVVKGDLSLVGPRPLLSEYMTRYDEVQIRRQRVLPGLTGLAQSRGRNGLPWPERLRLDAEYADRWSPALDLAILAGSVAPVVTAAGVSAEGQATVQRFPGTEAPKPP
jgi:sugar transferase EpsL